MMLAVSPQLTQYNKVMKDEKKLSFEILSDPGNRIADQYGIKYKMPQALITLYKQLGLKLNENNGDESWTIPMPARYIIDRHGMIRYADVNPDYTKRPEPEDTLTALEAMEG